ncbi:hypothetical protein [Clostridium beijerinckii]|uniref:hypothetical protein n=1 Tax=Clostridium beijerinckii TaxID=1520 RepID=UPI001361F418|nr:hypothetical protein [Clostridium beijerinckii]MZK73542.1 hypothetical protein [Clostridium beijerinckii]MZK97462.1 hypothetical protein [Clostridium beijerinckii]MZL27166.1 hypothetical protein [Clostridium beijerinckii]
MNNTERLWNISKNVRKKVQEKYTWEHKAKQIIELYEFSMPNDNKEVYITLMHK